MLREYCWEDLFSANVPLLSPNVLLSMIYSLFVYVLGRFLFARASSALSSYNILPQWHFHQSRPPSHAHQTTL